MSRVLPILFNTEMVQANLDGRKTATRRTIKFPVKKYTGAIPKADNVSVCKNTLHYKSIYFCEEPYCFFDIRPPYHCGDVLYVRETWAFQCCIECMNIYEDDSCMIGKASIIHEDKDAISEGCYIYRADHPHPERIIWRPSIHMPKAAARIWLKVTDVQPQRLQDMTLDDFLKEGIIPMPEAFNDPENAYMQAQSEFIQLWDSTIPKGQQDIYSWAANPWVWATEFKQCEKPESEE